MACLVGVAAAVHVGEVEAADGAQAEGVGEESADRGGAADLGDEDALAVAPDGVADVLGPFDQAFEQVGVDLVRIGRSVGSEIGQMEDDAARTSPASGCKANSSIQPALTRTSGLSGLEGRQETDQ